MSGENRYGSLQVATPSQYPPPQATSGIIHQHHTFSATSTSPIGFPSAGHLNAQTYEYRSDQGLVTFNPTTTNPTDGPYAGDMMNSVAGASHARIHPPPPPPPPPPPQFASPSYQSNGAMAPGRSLAPNGSSIQWNHPSYYPTMGPDSETPRRHPSQDAQSGHPPYSPLDNSPWADKARSASFPSRAHEQGMQHNIQQKFNPSYNRHPIEPPNAAPSPPTQYPPNSPRTPISSHNLIPPGSIPEPRSSRYRGPPGSRPSLTGPVADNQDHGNYADASPAASYQQSHVPRHVSMGNGHMGGQMSNGVQGGFVGNSHHYVQQHRGSESYIPSSGHKPTLPSNGGPHTNGNPYDEMSIDKEVKRENDSRTGSASLSPAQTRTTIKPEDAQSPGSHDRTVKSEPLENPAKKRGLPVFNHNGVEYYENEPVPLGVPLPRGWQLGIGKMTKDLLLPVVKDGISVNPEWGFTAGGKARQRLPQACVNCRQKKIKCVESDHSETICQHCTKMRIQCERVIKEEEKKKKGRGQDKIKSERSTSIMSDTALSEHRIAVPKSANRKRKQSDDSFAVQRKVSRQTISRAGSINSMASTREPLNTALANSSAMNLPPPPQSAPAGQERAALFPTMATMAAEDKMVLARSGTHGEESRVHTVNMLRDQYALSGVDASPQSYVSSPTTSIVGPPSLQSNMHYGESMGAPVLLGYAGSSSSRNSPPSSGTPTHSTPSIPRPMGMDPRHQDLPDPELLKHLVDVYFTSVFSQTYAFLHQPSFERNMDQQPAILLFSICAVAARFSTRPDMADHWAKRARDLIMQNYDLFTLSVIQSMVNMGLHDFGSNNGHKAWMFCGMAVRMGASINLNLENKKSKEKSIIEKEMGRRTYWSYYLMDRFNSYGVARPYLTQDHDCHIQLPCDQPSFMSGQYVVTEWLLEKNPYSPQVDGTKYMGAMAYLVRIAGIWGNILRRIHLSAYQVYCELGPLENEFDNLVKELEDWRRKLPINLIYSSDNLAGQAKFGTTGAFVVMHVMWHTAMQYVHRYVRTVGEPETYIEKNIAPKSVVESIRKAFIHADSVLQIMAHVQKKKAEAKKNGTDPIVVNAPFLGQAILDACNVTAMRAMELHKRGVVGTAEQQLGRVHTGLKQLRELRKYWKPVEAMYKKLKQRYHILKQSMQPRQSTGSFNQNPVHTPGSSTDSLPPNLSYPVEPVEPGQYGPPMSVEQPLNPVNFAYFSDYLANPSSQHYINEAFVAEDSQLSLYNIANTEGGFAFLYGDTYVTEPQQSMNSFASNLSNAPDLSLHTTQLQSAPDFTTNILPDNPPCEDDEDDEDDDEHDNPPSEDARAGGGDINAMYFDPLAVSNGKLDNSPAESSHGSRRASAAGDGGAGGARRSGANPMDVMYLVDYERLPEQEPISRKKIDTEVFENPSRGKDGAVGGSGAIEIDSQQGAGTHGH